MARLRVCVKSPVGSASAPSALPISKAGRSESCAQRQDPLTHQTALRRRCEMPRVIVTTDEGEMIWNEGVQANDFEGEHFRRALVDRVGWAVADAESTWHLATEIGRA